MSGQEPPQVESPEEVGSGPPVEEGAPSWTVTFGDMMSLLLTFFILLFSMSELKVEKFLLASQSLREAMGGTAAETTIDPLGLMPDPVDPDLELSNPGLGGGSSDYLDVFTDAYMRMIAERLEKLVSENGLEELVEVDMEDDGVYLRIQATALFESGDATVRAESQEIVTHVADITRELGIPTVVSGHADNQPIRTAAFPSNWELSAARAAGVARILVAEGQDPRSIRVHSYGEYDPVADNATADGRALNRRVELFFSRNDIRDAALRLQGAASADAGESSSG